MKIVEASFGKKAPDGLAADLRQLADAVDQGKVVDFVGCWIEDGYFTYEWAASKFDSVALTAMMHNQALHRMRENGAA